MKSIRPTLWIATLLLSAGPAMAAPAYVASTVNLRAGAGTNNEIVAKIPGGSLVEANNCSEWCEVDWQGKKGFAIASALDLSGRVPPARSAARRPGAPPPGAYIEDDDYVPAGPPVVYGAPYYPYGYYRPYGYRSYWGPRYRYGYRGYRRW